jgi:chitinase
MAHTPTGDLSTVSRRLSASRVATALVLVGASGVGGTFGARYVAQHVGPSPSAWFAPYVDTTLTPTYPFEDATANPARDAVLGFVVASPQSSCTPSWGGSYDLSGASTALDMDRRIARLRQQGGNVVVSFGGQRNAELAVACQSDAQLATAYGSVIERYRVNTVDFDIEGAALQDRASIERRAHVVASLQGEIRRGHRNLSVWLTLPVEPSGMTPDAVAAVDAMLGAHVDLAGVNLLTFDFGSSRPASTSMLSATEQALTDSHQQLISAYQRAGVPLTSRHVWAKMGATPMIGQNDTSSDRLDLSDARQLAQFVSGSGMGRLSEWSINRDAPCGPNVVDPRQVSNYCSGVAQPGLAFTQSFDKLPGRSNLLTAGVTRPDVVKAITDRASDSPYPIWGNDKGYIAGYKVVWHGNVFQAKWYNQSQPPDAPVAHAWDTPWELVGPVLPGEHAPTMPRLAPGTYPGWSPTAVYVAGTRVLLNGLAYQAKWWSQDNAPNANVVNPWDTPWQPLFTIPGEPVAAPS